MRIIYAVFLGLLMTYGCYSMKSNKAEAVYSDNVYFTLKNDTSKWYLKSLAEDLLSMQGIQAEIVFA